MLKICIWFKKKKIDKCNLALSVILTAINFN